MIGIEFNGKHTWRDFGITMGENRSIGYPSKEKIIVNVPFSNHEYDFSEIYGSQTYSHRELQYEFNLVDWFSNNTAENMTTTKTKLVNWLMNSHGKQRLYDDLYPNYYFLAEVESAIDIEEDWNKGLLKVTFKAYPFMIHDLQEGHDIWDTFNFELDVAQKTTLNVTGTQEIILINNGTPDVTPVIIADAPFTIKMNNNIYTINSGRTESTDFVFKNGENKLTLKGTGNIDFVFYQELI